MKKIWIFLTALALIVAGKATLSQAAPSSLRLTDTIKQGTGAINLLNSRDNMTAPMLEAFRSDNAGKLVFAVDINENSKGSENAKSQGVSIASASIVVTFAGGATRTYSQYATETQVLVKSTGTSSRQPYYSLLGDSGSSTITPRRISNQDFDSTLKFVIPDNLSTATSAILNIQLVNTDASQGDPENFYDYSGGYEDVAIITNATARYLDEVLPLSSQTVFRTQAPAMQLSPEGTVTQQTLLSSATATSTPSTSDILSAGSALSWVQRPGASTYNIVAYEDLYPSTGDYDFNDAVVAYKYELGINANGMIERVNGTAYLVARGANYTHDWTLDIPVPLSASLASSSCATANTAAVTNLAGHGSGSCSVSISNGKLQWKAFSDTRYIFPPDPSNVGPQANTIAGATKFQGPKSTFTLTFEVPIALSSWGADDPWLHVIDTNQDIRLSTKSANGFPFALVLPSAWQHVQEGTDMGIAYPAFSNFVKSSGAQSTDWYLKPDTSKTINWTAADWAW